MRLLFRKKLSSLLIVLTVTFIMSGCSFNISENKNQQLENEMDRLMSILKEKSFYYEDDTQLLDGAMRGIVDSLDDPYSTFFDEEEYNIFITQLRATFAGIGVSIAYNGDYPIVNRVYENSPAEKAGLKPGDTIMKIDETDIGGKTIEEIVSIIKGPIGTERTLVIARSDQTNPLSPIKITLGTISSKTVESHVKDKIGYIKITTFGDHTYDEFKIAMEELNSQNIEGLIFDVRDNPGGYLHIVKSILDYFIDSEEPFMYQEDRTGKKEANYLKDGHTFNQYKIAVLINEHSASASEIFAATMNEMAGYPLIGKTTFGKGTVQVTEFLNLEQTKAVKYTTSIWLTPSGKWIHKNGVSPTIEIDVDKYNELNFMEYSSDIAFDHVSQEIKEMQSLLSKLGYNTRQDGYFNEQTSNAVKEFQKDYISLDKATGFVTEETIYYLNLALIDYINDLSNDEQYQEAIRYLLK